MQECTLEDTEEVTYSGQFVHWDTELCFHIHV